MKLNGNKGINKFAARICFVAVVVVTWNYMLSLQKPNNEERPKSNLQFMNHFLPNRIAEKSMKIPQIVFNSTIQKLDLDSTKDGPNSLILLTSMRSGSSFFGQFFNQNPSIFYFFEPLYTFLDNCQTYQDEKVEYLANALNCNFRAFQKYINESITNTLKLVNRADKQNEHFERRVHNLKKCNKLGLCFAGNTEALCRTSKCLKQSCSACINNLRIDDVESKCRSSSLIAIKTVRTCHLSWLTRVQDIVGGQLKVVHLVRDPRAVALSRYKMHQEEGNIVKEMQKNCLFDQSIFEEENMNVTAEWRAKNYVLVRYEDLILHPLDHLKLLSSHYETNKYKVDLLHHDVLNWLETNTKISTGSLFSTSRNTTEQLYKWRSKITFKLAKDIQQVCSKMMKMYGYASISSPTQLRNLSENLIKPVTGT